MHYGRFHLRKSGPEGVTFGPFVCITVTMVSKHIPNVLCTISNMPLNNYWLLLSYCAVLHSLRPLLYLTVPLPNFEGQFGPSGLPVFMSPSHARCEGRPGEPSSGKLHEGSAPTYRPNRYGRAAPGPTEGEGEGEGHLSIRGTL